MWEEGIDINSVCQIRTRTNLYFGVGAIDSIQEIAASFHFTQSKVKSMLHRTRQGLRAFLREEGFSL